MHPTAAAGRVSVWRGGRSAFQRTRVLFAFVGAAAGLARGAAEQNQDVSNLNSLPEVEFKALSQQDWNPLGSRALAIHPEDWKHGETEHFI
ncbi:MAG: hypothetical protein ABIU29_02260, partial [Chthoniobacterales bacterium]